MQREAVEVRNHKDVWRGVIRRYFCSEIKPDGLILGSKNECLCGIRIGTERCIILAEKVAPGNPAKKVLSLLQMQWRMSKAKKLFSSRGYRCTSYAVYPSLDQPMFLYDMHETTRSYAERSLIFQANKKPLPIRMMLRILGVNPFNDTIILVGIRSRSTAN